ncbi:MAG: YdeI/OmpD-associated family protein [Actinomycetota bacterium]|nr:YdeI/OmpD-associated family protein [Actinomycetota bacterium]
MGSIEIQTRLAERGPAAAVVLNEEQVAAVGEGARRFPVCASVNGYTWRTSVVRMGGEFLVGLNREVREQAGVQAGDSVAVKLELDTAPREVEVPPALEAALAGDDEARATFDAMAYTHRKEFARWVAEAKREETRQRRVTQALQMLSEGKKLS